MNKLIKIRDVTAKYDLSARTLRYYEDMGLIQSIRHDDYAYRLYDEAAVKRLEQILILRRLNISIQDIGRIFRASGSEIVLEALGKKVGDMMKRYPFCMNSKRSFWILSVKSSRRISTGHRM